MRRILIATYMLVCCFSTSQTWAQGIDLSVADPKSQTGQSSSVSNDGVQPRDYAASAPGKYVSKGKSSDFLDLSPEGMFSLSHDGKSIGGSYKVQGDTLNLTFQQNRSLTAKFRFIGNTIIDPDGIVWEKQTEQQASKPQEKPEVTPAQTDSKMTNDEVIQLVKAGLSEQVIITAIRQAATKDFDLTPTGLIALKKAGVSDAVIVVMQERGTPGQAASASEPKTPPKYDANLAEPQKPAAPVSQNSCSGIELMGLYKDDMRPALPLIMWFAKVRNGTSITRIVTVSWTDLYGQDKSLQTEVKPGDIATLELTRQQPVERKPINLRLSSCR